MEGRRTAATASQRESAGRGGVSTAGGEDVDTRRGITVRSVRLNYRCGFSPINAVPADARDPGQRPPVAYLQRGNGCPDLFTPITCRTRTTRMKTPFIRTYEDINLERNNTLS